MFDRVFLVGGVACEAAPLFDVDGVVFSFFVVCLDVVEHLEESFAVFFRSGFLVIFIDDPGRVSVGLRALDADFCLVAEAFM